MWANSTCFGVRLLLGVLREQVGQDEQAVQRGPQLVRHVGEELRLVLRRQRELLGLLLELLLGQLDLPVLALDLGVLLGEQPGLLLELLVGLLQLLLLLLQELLGRLEAIAPAARAGRWSSGAPPAGSAAPGSATASCFSSSSVRMLASIVFRTMPMLSVSWSRKVRWTSLKRLEGGQLDDGLDLPLEEHREHDDVGGGGLAQPGVDLDVVVGDVGQQDALLLERALPDQPLALAESVGDVLALAVCVAGQQLQAGPRSSSTLR